MPESSPNGSAQDWPVAAGVLERATLWAHLHRSGHPDLLAISVYRFAQAWRLRLLRPRLGRRGQRDLDLLLIQQRCEEPIWEQLRRSDSRSLPLTCDRLDHGHRGMAQPAWLSRRGFPPVRRPQHTGNPRPAQDMRGRLRPRGVAVILDNAAEVGHRFLPGRAGDDDPADVI